MTYPDDKNWLDGPMFVEWLAEVRPQVVKHTYQHLGMGAHRNMRNWRSGCSVSIYTADKMLIAIGLHLADVPDNVWLADRKDWAA